MGLILDESYPSARKLTKIGSSMNPRTVLVLLLAALSAPALAQFPQAPTPYVPEIAMPGKDVVWVPTPQIVVDKMLDMARVTKDDLVMDLGSGDGRLVITAAKRGARAIGVEYNPDLVELSKRTAEKEGVADKATFVKADLFETDFSAASVITTFLLRDINIKLRPKILALKPGTRVVSNSFSMGDWKADETVVLTAESGCTGYCTALFWIVPARVAGIYKVPQGEITLHQKYQELSGTLRTGDKALPIKGKVSGEEISFRAGGRMYRGRMDGKKLVLR
jgi:SAM-dependent methyltransferase